MKVKLLRNLGTGLVSELGLEFTDDDGQRIYSVDSVRDVPSDVAEKLIAQGLAETTRDDGTKSVQAVPPKPAVTGPFHKNPKE